MHKGVGEDNSAGGRVDKKIKSRVSRIVRETKPERIILFGSYARGDFHEGSDIDVVVVGDFREKFTDRIVKLLGMNNTHIPLEVLAYTKEEFMDMIEVRNPFISEITREGIVVYSR